MYQGLRYLLEQKCLSSGDPTEIALFLHRHARDLDKRILGLFLGDSRELAIQTMHAYVDLMDFRSLDFLESLRIFLSDFLLPGESQKIDRFMLKFAAKFLNDNPGIFKDAGKRYHINLALFGDISNDRAPYVGSLFHTFFSVSSRCGLCTRLFSDHAKHGSSLSIEPAKYHKERIY